MEQYVKEQFPLTSKDIIICNDSTIYIKRYNKRNLKFLVGSYHRTQNSIEQEFCVSLTIPDHNCYEDIPVVIEGDDVELLLQGLAWVEAIICRD